MPLPSPEEAGLLAGRINIQLDGRNTVGIPALFCALDTQLGIFIDKNPEYKNRASNIRSALDQLDYQFLEILQDMS